MSVKLASVLDMLAKIDDISVCAEPTSWYKGADVRRVQE